MNTLQLSTEDQGRDVIFSELRDSRQSQQGLELEDMFADFDTTLQGIFIATPYSSECLDYQMPCSPYAEPGRETPRREGYEILTTLHSYEEPNYVSHAGDLTFTDKQGGGGGTSRPLVPVRPMVTS